MSEARLRGVYDREIRPLLETHAETVERLGKYGLYPIGVFLVAVVGLVASGFAERLAPAVAFAAVLIPTVAVLKVRGPLYQAGGAAFRALFKQEVMARVVAEVVPDATYEPDLAIARSVLASSGLVGAGTSYLGDDLVRGTIGRTPFALGDVRSERATGSRVAARFQGLFFHADFNRSLAGRTLVLPRGETPMPGERNRGLLATTLESPAFEAVFSSYATDPVEARYVLTPKMMERLVGLQRLLGRPLSAAFDRGRVYVAVDQGQGSFDALAFGGEKAWDEIRSFAALLDAARALVEELELDTRIWTKGFAHDEETRAASAFEPSAWAQVAAQGTQAFRRSRAPVRFVMDDPPAPPTHARVERRADGTLRARYPGGGGVLVVLALPLLCAASAVAPAWVPALRDGALGDWARLLRADAWLAALLALAVAAAAAYVTRQRVRRLEAGRTGLRTDAWARASRTLRSERILRVFAVEDLVMAQVDDSWIPALLSPRLSSHGAAVWLAAEIERALDGRPGAVQVTRALHPPSSAIGPDHGQEGS